MPFQARALFVGGQWLRPLMFSKGFARFFASSFFRFRGLDAEVRVGSSPVASTRLVWANISLVLRNIFDLNFDQRRVDVGCIR